MKSTNKKILVTGGAGFIGSNLCEYLVQDSKNSVKSLDNYSTGSALNHVEGVEYIKGDIKDIDQLIVSTPDIVYHLGEYSRVEQSFEDFPTVWESNKIGTREVLEFCLRRNCKVVYAGSSTKFGDGGLGRSQSPYGWSKASNTELVQNYGQWFGLNYAIVYFYNVYGPREIRSGKYATLIGKFAELMRHGEPLPVVSPGSQQRNFTHIDDIISGLVLVGEDGFGDDFGIGADDAYSVVDVASMFGGRIQMLPHRRGNRMAADVVIDKTRALGWKQTKQLPEYIDFLKHNRWLDG
jgi:UDP-glucose 4-epimerase